MKVTGKKEFIKIIEKLGKLLEACYLKESLGSNDGRVYLTANMKGGEQRVLCRVSRSVFKWYNLEELPCPYINLRYYKIGKQLTSKEAKSVVIPEKTANLLSHINKQQ